MDFEQKYELIEPLPGEGPQSYRARQAVTGREVSVHLLTGGKTPQNEAWLTRLRALPPHSLARLIEVGDHKGTQFVVTMAPPYLHLSEWIEEQERLAAESATRFSRAGAWKAPTAAPLPQPEPRPEPPPVVEAAPPHVPAQPDEFDQMFSSPPAVEEPQAPPPAFVAPVPAPPP